VPGTGIIGRGKRSIEAIEGEAVVCGDVIELYVYDRVQERHRGIASGKKRQPAAPERQERFREQNRNRARRMCRRLINSNVRQHGAFEPVFLTLTFKENVTDLNEAHRLFKLFIMRVNHRYNLTVKYVGVWEIQKGRREKYGVSVIHYHVVLFNLPFIDVNEIREKVWKQGFIKLNAIEGVYNLGSYVTKYMTKDNGDIPDGRKSYFTSRGLDRPQSTTNPDDVQEIIREVEEGSAAIVYRNEYESAYQGRVTYCIITFRVVASILAQRASLKEGKRT
jgi:hypothetical protein